MRLIVLRRSVSVSSGTDVAVDPRGRHGRSSELFFGGCARRGANVTLTGGQRKGQPRKEPKVFR
jgi:hypothetical protein